MSRTRTEEVSLNKDTDYLGQKYTVGANWYPAIRLSLTGQYYHKIASYNDDIRTASFPTVDRPGLEYG